MKRRTKAFFLIVLVTHLAGLGGFLVWRALRDEDMPPDRRVNWLQPPDRFQARGGRVEFDDINANPGGFRDFNGRVMHFAGAVLDVEVDFKAPPATFPFTELARQGYSVIRVPVRWIDLEPAAREIDVDVLFGIRAFLDTAAANGISVILQNPAPFPDDGWRPGVPCAPAWALRSPGEAARLQKCERKPATRVSDGDFDRFHRDFLFAGWTPDDLALQDHLIRSWVKMAEMVNRSAGLLAFGITSDMTCPVDVPRKDCQAAWAGFVDRFVNGLRAVGGSALAIVGTSPAWSGGLDGQPVPMAVITELVPIGAADFPIRFLVPTNGIHAAVHHPVKDAAAFMAVLAGLEERGRSFLVRSTVAGEVKRMATDGFDPFARLMAHPRPEAIAGRNAKWNFDRLYLPASPAEAAVEPGRTDVFSLTFKGIPPRQGARSETSIKLPVLLLYDEQDQDDSPTFTVDVSDGAVEWLPGRSDTIVWRTDDSVSEHKMKIVPWGGRRLDFITDLTDIPAR